MALDANHLHYPRRSYGMDHDRYDWSMLSDRKTVKWPDGAFLAIWININIQFFPLDQRGIPFKVPGGMTMPYPDLRHFTLRDYGNRVGIFRILDVLEKMSLKASFSIQTDMLQRAPYLMSVIKRRGDEVIAHGKNMDTLHYEGLGIDQELEIITTCKASLEDYFERPVQGWISPARNESPKTPDLLAGSGFSYFCDWVNDDMPYHFKTDEAELIAMPLSYELEDQFIINSNLHSEASYMEQVMDAADFLYKEAQTQGGRILTLNIHPWLLGQPHRIVYLERALEHIMSKEKVWSAYPSEILTAMDRGR